MEKTEEEEDDGTGGGAGEGGCAIRQIVRMSRARRLFQHHEGEAPEGYLLRRLRLTSPSSPSASSFTHSETLIFRLTRTQTHSYSDSIMLRLIMLRLAQTQTTSESLVPRPMHIQTYSHSDFRTL